MSGAHGNTPKQCDAVCCSSMRTPSSNSDMSPRNLLTAKPRKSARSSGRSRPTVPMIEANTPPRSMSATSSQGACTARDQAEVDQVDVAEIELGDAAGALDDDHVEPAGQVVVGAAHVDAQVVGEGVVAARRQRPPQPAVDDDLAAAVAVGLEQDRIHRRLGLQPARFRLGDLGAADLAAGAARVGVVRHVLRLERRHGNALTPQPGADGRRHPALARVGGGAADEDRPCRHVRPAAVPATPDTGRRRTP